VAADSDCGSVAAANGPLCATFALDLVPSTAAEELNTAVVAATFTSSVFVSFVFDNIRSIKSAVVGVAAVDVVVGVSLQRTGEADASGFDPTFVTVSVSLDSTVGDAAAAVDNAAESECCAPLDSTLLLLLASSFTAPEELSTAVVAVTPKAAASASFVFDKIRSIDSAVVGVAAVETTGD
jgi:hypothetical protein